MLGVDGPPARQSVTGSDGSRASISSSSGGRCHDRRASVGVVERDVIATEGIGHARPASVHNGTRPRGNPTRRGRRHPCRPTHRGGRTPHKPRSRASRPEGPGNATTPRTLRRAWKPTDADDGVTEFDLSPDVARWWLTRPRPHAPRTASSRSPVAWLTTRATDGPSVVDNAQRRGKPRDTTAGVRRAVERIDDDHTVAVARASALLGQYGEPGVERESPRRRRRRRLSTAYCPWRAPEKPQSVTAASRRATSSATWWRSVESGVVECRRAAPRGTGNSVDEIV